MQEFPVLLGALTDPTSKRENVTILDLFRH